MTDVSRVVEIEGILKRAAVRDSVQFSGLANFRVATVNDQS